VDTGALDRSYVSKELGNELLAAKGASVRKCEKEKVCTCNSTICLDCLGVVTFTVHFHNDLTNKAESFHTDAWIA
jgi:hypothetical protein